MVLDVVAELSILEQEGVGCVSHVHCIDEMEAEGVVHSVNSAPKVHLDARSTPAGCC